MNTTNQTRDPRQGEPLPPSWPERNVDMIIKAVVGLAVAVVAFELYYGATADKHVHFEWEAWPGFYAFAGFCSYVFLVMSAKQLRKLISRPMDYYDGGPPLLAFDVDAPIGTGHDEHEGEYDDEHDDEHEDEREDEREERVALESLDESASEDEE